MMQFRTEHCLEYMTGTSRVSHDKKHVFQLRLFIYRYYPVQTMTKERMGSQGESDRFCSIN
jgi:hypothetical protein